MKILVIKVKWRKAKYAKTSSKKEKNKKNGFINYISRGNIILKEKTECEYLVAHKQKKLYNDFERTKR